MQHGKRNLELFFATGLILALVMFIPPLASGQDFPSKPITIYVGYAAGGTCDLTARALASASEKLLGVPVVVENKPGATGTVATALVATKKPDGYTMAALGTAEVSSAPLIMKVNYDPEKDISPILQMYHNISGICVQSESPIKTAEEFIAYAKAHPGMTYASSGVNSIHHIATELFAHSKGLTFKHIPYKGGAEAITAFLGRHIDFLTGTGSHIPYVEQGKARLITVITTDKRDPEYPNVPTLTELGSEDLYPPGNILIGPKGIPDAVVKKLNVTFKKVMDGPDFQALLKKFHIPYDYKDGAQLARDLPAMTAQYKRAMGILGITVKKE